MSRLSSKQRWALNDNTKDLPHVDKGTDYPCSQTDLDGYCKFRGSNRFQIQSTSTKDAAVELLSANKLSRKPTSTQERAMHRLAKGLKIEGWEPDIVIKAFRDLDLAFFNGRLDDKVLVAWAGRTEFNAKRQCHALGVTGYKHWGRAQIALNSEKILVDSDSPWEEMWSTMLHEMIHAYFFVMCGIDPPCKEDIRWGRTHTDGHGIYFRMCIHAIHRRTKEYFGLRTIAACENYKQGHPLSDN